MRRIMSAGLLFVVMCWFAGVLPVSVAADPPKDSMQAEITRTKKLKGKVKALKFKQEQLQEILNQINGELKGQTVDGTKLTPIRFVFDMGISRNQRMDLDVKDVTVEQLLDQLLKQNEMGYVVVSGKPNEQNDGAVRIVKGNNRGYPDAQDPKKDKK